MFGSIICNYPESRRSPGIQIQPPILLKGQIFYGELSKSGFLQFALKRSISNIRCILLRHDGYFIIRSSLP
jgi:hypothetical protein